MPICKDREYRASRLLLPVQEGSEKRIDTDFYVEGHATTFDDPYLLYKFGETEYWEVIDRNALNGADMDDVIMQFDHAGRVMARMKNGSLIVEPQDRALFMAADLGLTDASRALYEDIRTGLVTQMSWAFTVLEDEYLEQDNGRKVTRTIKRVGKVYDVSAVSIPANAGTDIAARSIAWVNGEIDRHSAERRKREIERLNLKLKLEGF